MIFDVVVRRLRWLAAVPLLPQFFDACLLAATAVRHPGRLAAVEALEARVGELPGVELCVHRLGGTGFVRAGCEFAHLHGNGLLDVLLTRDLAAGLAARGRARPHHVFGPSAWVSFDLRSPSDLPAALELLHLALARLAPPQCSSVQA